MRFAKYHGIGNDFVMFADPEDRLELSAGLVAALCDRRFGVGADGVIRVAPGTDGSDLTMDYVNSDGSIGEMCGNGIRCLAVFAREERLTSKDDVRVSTGAGVKLVEIRPDGRVTVDMGPPIFSPAEVPVRWAGENALHTVIEFGHDGAVPRLEAACLSVGNPHAVLFVDDPSEAPVGSLGPLIERHELFPNGANVEFVTVESPDRVRMRVWERGSGETLACGTGACAVAVAARLLRGTNERVTVVPPGGELEIEWKGSLDETAPILMTGPVVKSFEGDVDLGDYT